jgi:hypothetical protein
MSPKGLMQMAWDNHDPHLSRRWAHAFIGNRVDEPEIDHPKSLLRSTQSPNTQLYVWEVLRTWFNLDEVGSSDREDRKSKKAIVK